MGAVAEGVGEGKEGRVAGIEQKSRHGPGVIVITGLPVAAHLAHPGRPTSTA